MFSLLKKLSGKLADETISNYIKMATLVVEVLSSIEFTTGSVIGVVNYSNDNIQHEVLRFKGKENIIVFCRSRMSSSKAKSPLGQKGFIKVNNLGSLKNVNRFLTN